MPIRLLLPLAWCAQAVFAQTPSGFTADVVHTVQAGETLFGIAAQFTGKPALWQELQRVNRVPHPMRMPPGIAIRIPRALLAPQPTYATVIHSSGDVRIQRPMHNDTEPVQAGQPLPEGSRIDVGSDGYLRLQMVDGSIMRVPANSSLELSRVRSQEVTHTTETRIDLKAGRVDADVRPRETRDNRFEVETPLAVASVRGTTFGVEVQADGAVTGEVTKGVVALRGTGGAQPRRKAEATLQAGQGAQVDAAGRLGQPRPLPDAPDLAAVPEVLADATALHFRLPMPGGDVAGHQVRIARDAGLEDVVRNARVPAGTELRLAALEDGDYTLGVRAFDTLGLTGREATRPLRIKAQPVAPLIQQPPPDAVLHASAVEFVCTRPEGSAQFRLQVARDADFQDLALDIDTLEACQHVATLPPGRYHWRVASIRRLPAGVADQGPFGAAQRFDLQAPPPAGPPPQTRNDDGSLQVFWAAVPGYRYRAQVSPDEGFATLVYDELQQAADLRLAHPPPGTYFVRIQTVDPAGNAGAFSTVQRVRVGTVLRDTDGNTVHDAAGQPIGRQ